MSLIPQDAVAVYSRDNEDPLMWRYRTESGLFAPISIVNDEELDIVAEYSVISLTIYVGAIVSNDRSIVYWVNNSRPLP